jgi:signal transduction histidine kinase
MQEETIILFVEDNEDLRENAALVLDLEGYTVELARDGREALDVLEAGLIPNLIVSDIMMPRMNGYEFFEAVRQMTHLRGVPFIFLTARGSRRDISTGKLLGADDYLVKPFDPDDFLIAVQNKLQRAADMRAEATESLNIARRNLVQMLSHELRTPLTYVTGGFALLAEELEGEATLRENIHVSLELIQGGTQRLNRLAEQMVLYAEVISGYAEAQIKENGEPLDLEYLVTDALALVQYLFDEHDVTILRTAPEDQPVLVFGTKDLLMTAFSEVIRNAIQYSPDGSQIDLVVERENDYGCLLVVDRGQGIAPKDQATIWDIMVQSERNRNEQQGAGMGLPITKGILNAHSGYVELYSILGQGTEIKLCIPLAT